MHWELVAEMDVTQIEDRSWYVVRDNGGEWGDFDLRTMPGRTLKHLLRPNIVRGRPVLAMKLRFTPDEEALFKGKGH